MNHRSLYLSLTVLLGLTLCLGATAQTSTPPSTPPTPGVAPTTPPTPAPTPGTEPPATGMNHTDQHQVDNYLINHPEVAQQLHNDPSLINNPQFLAQHPEVKQWMAAHPNAQRVASEHPDWAVKEAEGNAMSDAHHEVKTTDQFLSQHPKVASELAKDPSLVDNKQYLASHPALQGYLNNHPEIRNEWQQHPEAFTHATEGYAARHNQVSAAKPANGGHPVK